MCTALAVRGLNRHTYMMIPRLFCDVMNGCYYIHSWRHNGRRGIVMYVCRFFSYNTYRIISVLEFPINYSYHDAVSNNLLGFVFLDLMSRSLLVKFGECDRPIRFIWSALRLWQSDRYWNRAPRTQGLRNLGLLTSIHEAFKHFWPIVWTTREVDPIPIWYWKIIREDAKNEKFDISQLRMWVLKH